MPGGLRSVHSFAVYYGRGGDERLVDFDLVVLDPAGYTADDLGRVKSRGTMALAYTSALEVVRQPGQTPPAAALSDAGGLIVNPGFNNWVLDPRAAATRQRLSDLTEHALALGYGGLFLDTLADAEDLRLTAALAAEVIPAAAWLVADLASRFGCVLVQNRGFQRLLPLTAPYLDGACWEAFPYAHIGPDPRVHTGVRTLQDLRSLGLRVLALNDGIVSDSVRRAACATALRCGFLWYGTPHYTDPPNSPLTR